jgi:hypothetical protein
MAEVSPIRRFGLGRHHDWAWLGGVSRESTASAGDDLILLSLVGTMHPSVTRRTA